MADGNGAPVGNPEDTGSAVEGQGQTPGGENPFAELDEATRDWVEKRHGGDVAKLAQQAFELDKYAGRAVAMPGDNATEDDWNTFYTKMGRPEKADAYQFAPPENMPETIAYNDELAGSFREAAFKEGLRPDQAARLHDWFVGEIIPATEEAQQRMAANVEEQVESANTALRDAWGDPQSETFQANIELASRFFDAVDEKGELAGKLSALGLIGPDKEVLVPELAFAFAKAGAAIYTEGGTLDGAGDSLAGANPFEGEVNLTNVMALVKTDPDKARMLAKAAGENPADYGL